MLYSTTIDGAKPKAKPYKLSDGNGLHLLVNPNGSKLWRLRYRFAGKQLMLSLGAYPEVSLATARQKRDDARKLLAEGKNPSEQRREDKLKHQVATANTFGAIAKELIEKLEEEGKPTIRLSDREAEGSITTRESINEAANQGGLGLFLRWVGVSFLPLFAPPASDPEDCPLYISV
jgi:hypothetical protein